ncbi:MAG TPA: pantetheine-phosphate adenylyltransferase [Candidatus Omnitrophota bacterium]|nr:pantetheine-phosphate adenylyltransferase [Candidatus Omnitrophota bacterium]HNQ51174.1 pantetheine-phosphate adenylyltransferase [Candidatus Omnitrophota bacterium]HQO38630.1 pantetheine-phosphate adenylyltransferase [Candidatus Omnitrophota bacterium]HQQ06691.1 pantetheine-phosphate adenylyltransferase [Candidatus Omnitrophota bacterium]
MSRRAIYPGTFDPCTFGHLDIIKRAREIFPEVIVAVAHNPQKRPLFSVAERVTMLKKATQGMKGVSVTDFNGLAVKFAADHKTHVLIRGVRMLSDYEYEFQMALTNRKLAPDIETIFLMPQETFSYISSKLLKEGAALGADLSSFVPKFIALALKKKIRHEGTG